MLNVGIEKDVEAASRITRRGRKTESNGPFETILPSPRAEWLSINFPVSDLRRNGCAPDQQRGIAAECKTDV